MSCYVCITPNAPVLTTKCVPAAAAPHRAGLAGGGLDDFADDVADLVAASGGTRGSGAAGGTPLELAYGKTRLSQLFGADLAAQQAAVRALPLCYAVTAYTLCHAVRSVCYVM